MQVTAYLRCPLNYGNEGNFGPTNNAEQNQFIKGSIHTQWKYNSMKMDPFCKVVNAPKQFSKLVLK